MVQIKDLMNYSIHSYPNQYYQCPESHFIFSLEEVH